jgi:uncharacterized membrane protein
VVDTAELVVHAMKLVGAVAVIGGPITAAAMALRRVGIAVTPASRYYGKSNILNTSDVLNTIYGIEVGW